MQADAITDHARIWRVSTRRAQKRNLNTLLIDEHRSDFDEYLTTLSDVDRMIAECIPTRYILTNNYDAMCFKTDFGSAIVISEVLRYFLYFMNLANLDLPDVPEDVRTNARLIAVRTLLMNEALDFDLDPRGVVPAHIHLQLDGMVRWQMKFVIGHEFAHHRLGHSADGIFRAARGLDEAELLNRPTQWDAYRRAHEHEFEADLHSILGAEASEQDRYSLFIGGTTFLLHLTVFETVMESIHPEFGTIFTHPPTMDRFHKLVDHFKPLKSFQIERTDVIVKYYENLANDLVKGHSIQPDTLTKYGSLYLADWQGPPLVDRVDY